jgi:hypothetical protein
VNVWHRRDDRTLQPLIGAITRAPLDPFDAAVVADDQRGSAHWEATYTFSKTGRQVLNIIDAAFEFKDGKIVRHTDSFNFWRWAGQALGPVGKLFGWAPPLKRAVGKEAMRGLDAWMAKNKIA